MRRRSLTGSNPHWFLSSTQYTATLCPRPLDRECCSRLIIIGIFVLDLRDIRGCLLEWHDLYFSNCFILSAFLFF